MKKNNWIYQGQIFTEEMTEGFFGFVYLITNLTNNRKYIGRKYFNKKRSKKVKDKKRRKITVSKSDWENYYGSCEELKKDVQLLGKENFSREILSLHKNKSSVNYTETKEQFQRDVLFSKLPDGTLEYYNYNILGRYYAKNFK